MAALLQAAGWGLLGVWVLMTAVWVISLILKDSSIVDVVWGLGFAGLGWLYFALGDGFAGRKVLLMVLVTIWGLRLAIHILLRNWGQGEDFRYKAWREEHGSRWWWRSYFEVFMLQGGLMWVISAPLLAAQASSLPDRLTGLDIAGVAVWAIGFFFEAVGDWQLARFRRNPANRGKLLTSGVWQFTRHPNYFGDATQWWGFALIAAAAGGWWTVFSPAIMTYLLVRVSGVAMLERSLVSKPGYEAYMARTSTFIPWFPKRAASRDQGRGQ